MPTQRIPYSEWPPKPFEWIDSGQRIYFDNNGFPGTLTVYDSFSPLCPKHGLMAQGFDYWYCEECEMNEQRKSGKDVIDWQVAVEQGGILIYSAQVVEYDPDNHPDAPYGLRDTPEAEIEWHSDHILSDLVKPPVPIITLKQSDSAFNPSQNFSVEFHDAQGLVIGKLTIVEGKLAFEGQAAMSAQVLFTAFKQLVDDYIADHRQP